MVLRTRMFALIGVSALLFAACGGDGDSTASSQPNSENQPTGDEAAQATVLVASSEHGDILSDSEGTTLYMFVPDENGEPTCYDDCAASWPALEATGAPSGGDGIEGSLLGTVERTDGATQVTYNDMPLYYFSGDKAAGDTNGQGISDVWWVVAPSGDPVMDKAASADDSYGG